MYILSAENISVSTVRKYVNENNIHYVSLFRGDIIDSLIFLLAEATEEQMKQIQQFVHENNAGAFCTFEEYDETKDCLIA